MYNSKLISLFIKCQNVAVKIKMNAQEDLSFFLHAACELQECEGGLRLCSYTNHHLVATYHNNSTILYLFSLSLEMWRPLSANWSPHPNHKCWKCSIRVTLLLKKKIRMWQLSHSFSPLKSRTRKKVLPTYNDVCICVVELLDHNWSVNNKTLIFLLMDLASWKKRTVFFFLREQLKNSVCLKISTNKHIIFAFLCIRCLIWTLESTEFYLIT